VDGEQGRQTTEGGRILVADAYKTRPRFTLTGSALKLRVRVGAAALVLS
jgi:hypothetical protein